MRYDWIAALASIAALVVLTWVCRFLAFRVPALRRMRDLNEEADRAKLARKRFADAVKINNRVAILTNLVFWAAVLPFSVSLETRPLWQHLVQIIAILMIFDLFYYLTHRFLFHGPALRKVHALHHQARTPTYVDALYVHPVETVIGLALFLLSIPLVAWLSGGPIHAFAVAIATLVFTQINTINHTYVDLPSFPFKTLDYVTGVHAAHHIDMSHGNYATLTMLYDRLFGTYEEPVRRATP